MVSVDKARALGMVADDRKHELFPWVQYPFDLLLVNACEEICIQIGSRIVMDQLSDGFGPVSDHGQELLDGNRGDLTPVLSGISVIKDSQFL